eukprot:1629803-Amphidinium_carterae.1
MSHFFISHDILHSLHLCASDMRYERRLEVNDLVGKDEAPFKMPKCIPQKRMKTNTNSQNVWGFLHEKH